MQAMNVYQKIIEVKKVCGVFTKDASTTGFGAYKYVSGSQVLSTIKAKMEEVGLLFVPVNVENRCWSTFDYVNSKGDTKTDFIVEGKVTYRFVNAENPDDHLDIPWEFYGQQNDISKAFGSGLTYTERYMLLKTLGIPTDDEDPDAKNEPKAGTPKKPAIPKANGQKSKYQTIAELAKAAGKTVDDACDWVKKKYKQDIRLNDLSEEQFAEVCSALKNASNGT